MRNLVVLAAIGLALMAAPQQYAHAQTNTPPTAFALQQSDFPTPATVLKSQTETNDLIAAEKAVLHFGAPFTTEGRISGYYMETVQANVEPSGATHPVVTYYLVSSFPTPDLASAAFGQQRDGWEKLVAAPTGGVTASVVDLNGQQFGDLAARGLYAAETPTSAGATDLSELLFKRGVYLIEVFQVYLHTDATPYGAAARPFVFSIGHKLDAIAAGTGPVVPPVPTTKADFSILKVRVEKDASKPNLKQPALTKVKAGAKVRFSTYFTVKTPPADNQVKADFRLTFQGKSLHHAFTKALVPGPATYYRYSIHGVQITQTGKYTLTGTITMGGVTHSAKSVFAVTGP